MLFGFLDCWGREEKQESQEMLANSPVSESNPSVRDHRLIVFRRGHSETT